MTTRATVVRGSPTYVGKQGPTYAGGVSAESAGSEHLWLGRVELSPGGRTKAHLHEHEVLGAGEYVYLPQGVPHVAVNRSATKPVIAIVARTDPNEQESVVLLPELEAAVPP